VANFEGDLRGWPSGGPNGLAGLSGGLSGELSGELSSGLSDGLSADLAEQSDEALVNGVRAGSEPHFEALYARSYDRIYAYVYKRVHSHPDAEELVQETFISLLQSLDSYRGQSSLLAWLYGIARNTVNNQLRRSISRREKMDAVDCERLTPVLPLLMDSPVQQLQLSRFADTIRTSLGALAPWHTKVFVMRHLDNLSIQEIVDRTDRSSDAVRSSLYRVKRLLLEAAQGDGAEGDATR
jgi:RNA polymerase sigma-70 factor (ECF subfamily)